METAQHCVKLGFKTPPTPEKVKGIRPLLTAGRRKMPVKMIAYNHSALGLIASEAQNIGVPAFRDAMAYPKADHAIVACLV